MASSYPRDQLLTALGAAYTIEREIGRGGMATVYLATDTKHHRPVALKVLAPELAASLGSERFRREIAFAAKLQHPHILPVLDSGETANGQLWFTMPFVEGESLRDRIRRQQQLSFDDAVRIAREVALALDYAHRHGVVHRDIKPENILLVDDQALVADFGIARALDPNDARSPATDGGTLTGTGITIGTPAYMSPEQAAGERMLDGTTDIYSLGAVLYEMLTGGPPFPGPTAQALAAKMMAADPPSPRRTRPAVPVAVDMATRKALALLPADRYATGADFAKALDTPTATPAAQPRGASGRLRAGLAALAIGISIGAALFFAKRNRESGMPAYAGAAASPVGIAVLPFDAGRDTTNAYFADGITDEIRGKLAALPGLQVIARTSSNEYAHTPKPASEIGRELGVQYLLAGTVEWEQSPGGTRRVRVSPELIQVDPVRAPVTRWQQSYDTTLADVFDVQAAIATRVAASLGLVLTPPAQAQMAARPTQNLAAYDAYLRSTALEGTDPATVRDALAAAEQAVALDTTFSAAWARVSTRHTSLYANSVPTRADADAARQAADRAIALAPAASDGYFARGTYNFFVANDLSAARADLETALRLAPSSAETNSELSEVAAAEGQWPAALSYARQAVALDPRSPFAAWVLTRALLWLRRDPEARAEAERGLAFAPAHLGLITYHAMSLLGQGDLAGARAAVRGIPPTLDRAQLLAWITSIWNVYLALDTADRALVLSLPPAAFDNDRGTWGLVHADLYWLGGDTTNARRYADSARVAYETQLRATPDNGRRHLLHGLTLAYLGRRAAATQEGERGLALAQITGNQIFVVPYARYTLARVYAAVGDHARALDQLEAVLAKPYFISPAWLRIDPTWDSLRGEPRFERMIEQAPMTAAR